MDLELHVQVQFNSFVERGWRIPIRFFVYEEANDTHMAFGEGEHATPTTLQDPLMRLNIAKYKK